MKNDDELSPEVLRQAKRYCRLLYAAQQETPFPDESAIAAAVAMAIEQEDAATAEQVRREKDRAGMAIALSIIDTELDRSRQETRNLLLPRQAALAEAVGELHNLEMRLIIVLLDMLGLYRPARTISKIDSDTWRITEEIVGTPVRTKTFSRSTGATTVQWFGQPNLN